jgi:hypothetical protein
MLIFFITGMLAIMAGVIIWGINRMLTQLRHPPPFHGSILMFTLAQPSMFGVSLAMVPVTLAVYFYYIWFLGGDPTNGGSICTDPELVANDPLTASPLCLQVCTLHTRCICFKFALNSLYNNCI